MQLKRKYLLIFFSFIPLVLFSRIPRVTQEIQMTSQSLFRPVLLAGSGFSNTVGDFFNYFFLFWKTFEKLEQNRTQIAVLESQLESFKEISRENERLRTLLDFKDQYGGKSIAARVIGWDLSPWRKAIVLDKGTRDGLRKDLPVIVPEGLVGRIVDVGPSTARVLLLIDPEARVAAMAAESRSQGVAAGRGTISLTLDYLGLDSGVAIGEPVLTSGATPLFPKGIRIGKVRSIEKSRDGLHLSAFVEPVVSFFKLEEVLCIVSFPPES